jgi:glyoxylase-like metal-dependent hydrolase (beta-lactamase superfamily II)
VLPVIEAGQALLIDEGAAPIDGLAFIGAAGHTIGQIAALWRNGSDGVLFAGDALHRPIQMLRPLWNTGNNFDHAQARASRRKLLDLCAGERCMLAPAHFRFPHACRVERHCDG